MSVLTEAPFLERIPVELTVELGRTTLTVRELARLGRDDVIDLDRGASEPLDIVIGGRVFARAEVVVVDDRVALRIVEVIGADGPGHIV